MPRVKFGRKRLRSSSSRRRPRKAPRARLTRNKLSFRNPFPEKHFCTLTYVTQGILPATAVGQGRLVTFRANSIHDPDLSGLGHQPRYHDTLSDIYNRYVVVGSTITVRFFSPSSAAQGQCMVYTCIRPSSADVPIEAQTYTSLLEQGGIRFKPLGARDGGSDIKSTRAYFNPWKLFKKSPYDEDDHQANYGSNPVASPTFALGVVPVDLAGTVGGVKYTVMIRYRVMSFRKYHNLAED